MIFMATKKKDKTEKKTKAETRDINKQVSQIQEKKYDRIELADIFGMSAYEMRTYYSLAGIPIDTKLTITEARTLFKSI